MENLSNIIRIIIALTSILFGSIKVFGIHMSNSDNATADLKKNNSPKTVFWFFGLSGMYLRFIGFLQIMSGILIVIPKTNLIGAMISFILFLNISLINFAFNFGTFIKLYVLLINFMCLFLLYSDIARLGLLIK